MYFPPNAVPAATKHGNLAIQNPVEIQKVVLSFC